MLVNLQFTSLMTHDHQSLDFQIKLQINLLSNLLNNRHRNQNLALLELRPSLQLKWTWTNSSQSPLSQVSQRAWEIGHLATSVTPLSTWTISSLTSITWISFTNSKVISTMLQRTLRNVSMKLMKMTRGLKRLKMKPAISITTVHRSRTVVTTHATTNFNSSKMDSIWTTHLFSDPTVSR